MTFVAQKSPYRVIDAERGWEMTTLGGLGIKNFKLTHTSGAHVVFTAKNVPEGVPSGYQSQWQITAVGHKPSAECNLERVEQRALIRDAMAAYGYFYGDGAGPTFLKFE